MTGTYTTIDLSQLPAPDIIESLDFETLLAARKARLISLYPAEEQADLAARLALESEPLNKLLQENTYRELLLRQRINEGARACMLAYSSGSNLDHLLALLGAERLPDEQDPTYRERGRQAPFAYSTAGPAAAYRYHTLSAAPDVLDVAVDSPLPGHVRVTVLSRDGAGLAAPELLSVVAKALNAEDVRPLNDSVTVQSATLVEWVLAATLYIPEGPAPEPVMAAAQKAAQAYADSCHRLGVPLRLSALYAALHQPGVSRVALQSPLADLEVDPTQALSCTHLTLTRVAVDG